jgi:uncharacterized small protein (TIGR04563 family)
MKDRRKPHLKQSLYFPEEMMKELKNEAERQDRTLSWLVQRAWEIARGRIMVLPSIPRE